MKAGDVIADRFEIVKLAGRGGMGTVYRATDLVAGGQVAVKLLGQTAGQPEESRFSREAKLLAGLDHPAIVRHVAHGTTPAGARYMAMEWLHGEDLASRLQHSGLSIEQSLALVRRAAGAMAAAHQQGIIHRDIKPSNLFLVDGEPARTKVLDFGIARPTLASTAMTRTGALVGTLSYMAPEQARGERRLDSRLDVFALGTVLYECLTGEQAFAGNQAVGVLAKILFNETPRVREVRPALPEALDALVARLMAKTPEERPGDGAAVLEALDALGRLEDELGPPEPGRIAPALTGGEQRLLSVMLVSRREDLPAGREQTLTPAELARTLDPLRSAVEPLGADLAVLADGAALVRLQGHGTATDQAARAAACALAIRSAAPEHHVALATGPADVSGQWPVGRVIDRAAALLDASSADNAGGVRVDEVTAGLLDARYELEGTGDRRVLRGRRAAEGARPLLGKPTPCVGRARELGMLELMLAECTDEPQACAALLSGPAGVGKSRVAHEFVERVREREIADTLVARGDPVYAGSAFALAAQLVRHDAGLHEGDAPSAQHAGLRRHLETLFEGEQARNAAEFLGVLVGAPTREEPSPQLLAARHDARIMSEQLRTTFVAWLGRLTARGPVLVVLEDLHWGDLPSVTFLDAALRHHAEAPLMVLALARPEVHELFPRLWADAGLQEIGLGALKRRAAEKLVRSVLGDDVGEATRERIVAQAQGNAFYLEELIRHVAEGDGRAFPETVVAMAQSRLEALEPEARLILRVASIYGEVFWEDAARALLGSQLSAVDLAGWLDSLIRRELLEPGRRERFPGERELAFRHDLHREAAYGMLTGGDRTLGHSLAARWLVAHGEPDALVVAEHFRLGEQPARAVPHYVKAAQSAFDGGNLRAVQEITERGLACGADGPDRGALLLLKAHRHGWNDELPGLATASEEALGLLPQGSTSWMLALAGLSHAAAYGANPAALMQALAELQGFTGELRPIGPTGASVAALVNSLHHLGQRSQALELQRRIEAIGEDAHDPVFMGWLHFGRTIIALYEPELAGALESARAARAAFLLGHDELATAMATMLLGSVEVELGLLADCERHSRDALERAERLGTGFVAGYASIFVGLARILAGRPAEGEETLAPLLGSADPMLATIARMETAYGHLLQGNLDEARQRAEQSVEATGFLPLLHGTALAVRAAVQLAADEPDRALDTIARATALGGDVGLVPMYGALLRITEVEALLARAQPDLARDRLREARERLERQAGRLADSTTRESFFAAVPPHARTRELARTHLDG